jgi:hypothetical protein
LECGAIATVPGSGSDCLVADLELDGSTLFWAPNEARRATTLSVAAHTLYEKSHPHLFGMPGGYLDTSNTKFVQMDEYPVRYRVRDATGTGVIYEYIIKRFFSYFFLIF